MNGHVPHDEEFAGLISDPTRTVAALWPAEDALSMRELKERADRNTNGNVTLVAVDATWNGARHLAGSYPRGMLKVKLDLASVFGDGDQRSLMAGLRKYAPSHADYASRCAILVSISVLLTPTSAAWTKWDTPGRAALQIRCVCDKVIRSKLTCARRCVAGWTCCHHAGCARWKPWRLRCGTWRSRRCLPRSSRTGDAK